MKKNTNPDYQTRSNIYLLREKLMNNIAKKYKIPIEIKLVSANKIINNAEGCYEGDQIKIRKSLPLFTQLLVLEHEIGHYFAQKDKNVRKHKTFKIVRKNTDKDEYEEEEIKAWKWVESHPITNGGIIDKEIKQYTKNVLSLINKSSSPAEALNWIFWF